MSIRLLQNIGTTGGSKMFKARWAQNSLQQFMEEQGCNMTWPRILLFDAAMLDLFVVPFHEEMSGMV